MNASDVDIGDNARVSYTITSGDDGRFAIDGVTGEVKTTSTFDRETKSSYQVRSARLEISSILNYFVCCII